MRNRAALVFDMMLMHSATNARGNRARHVLFSTFFDDSCAWPLLGPAFPLPECVLRSASYALLPPRPSSAPPTKFLAEFRAALPPGKRGLLDWAPPPAPRL